MRRKQITSTIAFRNARPLLVVLAIAVSACIANGQPTGFAEHFSGPNLDAAFTQGGNLASHPETIAGTYDMTHINGDLDGGTKLSRSTLGTLSSYTHEVEVVVDPFLLTGSGGTKTDFKWKIFGADGFMEVVLNSFGAMRVFHNDFNGGAGNVQDNTNIDGLTDGDLLNITTAYDQGSDTINVSYSINGGSVENFYSGGGIDGHVGDIITNFVEVEVFKFSDDPTDQAMVAIDNWSLAADTGGTPGDFDSDDDVDGPDFLIWQRGDSPLGGTPGELSDWQTNYGPQSLVAASAAVPEPSGMLLAIASAAMFGLDRSSKRKN